MSASFLTLPASPNLEHLKAQAKDLRDATRAADSTAIGRVQPYFPDAGAIGLNDAQLVVAREYGFASWAKLKAHVALRALGSTLVDRADRLVETAMRRETLPAVRALLAEEPLSGDATLSAACATGNAIAVGAFIDADPTLLNAKIAPKDWEPLLYVCFSCLLKDAEYRPRLIETARLLIARGANVNASWLDTKFDAQEACLYGATGVNDCPELAEMLLQAGADPNDCESAYHSTELPTPACLKLLLDYGGDVCINNALAHMLDREEPDWLRMMLTYAKDPAQLPPVISFALLRGRSAKCVHILIDAGVDVNASHRFLEDQTPFQAATRLGRMDVVEMLITAGADTTLSPADAILGRLARGEHVPPAEIAPAVIAALDAEKPTPALGMLAENGVNSALESLLIAGANPNVTAVGGRTPLHEAALHGRLETVRILLRHGADPTIRDSSYNAQAVGWACQGSYDGEGDAREAYVAVVAALLDAGCTVPETAWGSPEVQALLVARGARGG